MVDSLTHTYNIVYSIWIMATYSPTRTGKKWNESGNNALLHGYINMVKKRSEKDRSSEKLSLVLVVIVLLSLSSLLFLLLIQMWFTTSNCSKNFDFCITNWILKEEATTTNKRQQKRNYTTSQSALIKSMWMHICYFSVEMFPLASRTKKQRRSRKIFPIFFMVMSFWRTH